ncbi:MAG: trigger factor [Planctomycetales bacterium]|nr:trigger factor [Planctomycetales bacterium]
MSSADADIKEQNQADEEKQKLSLDVKIDKPSACQRHVTVTISEDDVKRYFSDAFSELMPRASVPGFRAGRAPRRIVESRFRSEVSDQVKGTLLMDSMTQVTEDHEFSAISEPEFDFDAIEIPESGALTFEFDIEVRPEFELPKWKGLKLEKLVREFTKEDIDLRLERLLMSQAGMETVEEPVALNDFITVDIAVKKGNEIVAEETDVLMQVHPILSFPDAKIVDFDKLVVGARASETKSVSVMISHDAPREDLQGEEVDVEFTVKEVQRTQLPAIDDALLERFGMETEGDLRDAIKSELERRLQYQQQQRIRNQITSLLTEAASWDLPPELLARQSSRELERAIMELRSSGYSESEIRAFENELRQNSRASTRKALQEHFILERIAEENEIDAVPEDFEREITLMALQSNDSVRRVRARIEKRGLTDALRNQIIERKVIELITSEATFTDTKYEPEKHETEAVDVHLCGQSQANIPSAKYNESQAELEQPVDRT